jgi:tRNA(Arg) A34 adenosine deaminase TadA
VETRTGKLVSVGVNCVLSSGLSATHAEVVALSLAQVRVGTWDLGGQGQPEHELVVNWRPCAQCMGATLWSGVTRLIIAGTGPELEELTGFDEGPVRDDWIPQLRRRGVEIVSDVLRDEAIAVFADYGRSAKSGQVTVYNARGASETP